MRRLEYGEENKARAELGRSVGRSVDRSEQASSPGPAWHCCCSVEVAGLDSQAVSNATTLLV